MDVPRLSTIQALLILMKARESAPKRGYYYRSWMNLQKLISMAKDLELHEHFVDHQEGRPCGSDPTECIVKTRIWQTMYMCEMMIAGPQGNTTPSLSGNHAHLYQDGLISTSPQKRSTSVSKALQLAQTSPNIGFPRILLIWCEPFAMFGPSVMSMQR